MKQKAGRGQEYFLYCDGASRGNPGHASLGALLLDANDEEIFAIGRVLGDKITNNVAEYESLICGLQETLQRGIRNLCVRMDSQLVVRQMQGRYKVKHPGLQPLYRKAKSLSVEFAHFEIEHVPREENKRADQLANEALDA